MHTRTIAAALMASIDEIIDGDTGSALDGALERAEGIENDGTFYIETVDGERFRVDVIRAA